MSLHRCKYATSSITAKDAVYHWCKHAVGYAGHESLSGFVDGMAGVSGAVAEGKVAYDRCAYFTHWAEQTLPVLGKDTVLN